MVREVKADEWKTLRDVRLAALSEAPQAFGSTYAREAPFAEEHWRARLSPERSVTFFADAAGGVAPGAAGGVAPGAAGGVAPGAAPAGLAGVYVEDGAADLVSMWVRPAARGLGVGEALVSAAAGWAKARGYGTLYLWVTETNAAARRLYERCGFTPTGERQPLPSDPSLPEIQMSLPL